MGCHDMLAARINPETVTQKIANVIITTGKERFFNENDLIVSKTDTGGRITYANDVFLRVAGLKETAALGAPHSIIRHPDMPRAVFKLLWDTLGNGQEIFAYVKNLASNGDHYWVLAHVTPSYDRTGKLTGYHSSRRLPSREAVASIAPLYESLLEVENKAPSRKTGLENSVSALFAILHEKGIVYDEFVLSL